jgi:hypothetical protein
VALFGLALAAGWILVIGTLIEKSLDSADTGSVVFGFYPAAFVEMALVVLAPLAAMIFLQWTLAHLDTNWGSLAALIGPVLAFAAGAILTYDLEATVSTSPDTGFSVVGFWFGIGILFAGTVAFAVVGLVNWRSVEGDLQVPGDQS